jgi:hypothetical protein
MTDTPAAAAGNTTPGWRPDPYGRAGERYFDGSRWTDRISTRGQETVDPLGNTATIAFSIPPSAPRAATDGPSDETSSPSATSPSATSPSATSPSATYIAPSASAASGTSSTASKIWQIMAAAAIVQLVLGIALLVAGALASRTWLVIVGGILIVDAIVLTVLARRVTRPR